MSKLLKGQGFGKRRNPEIWMSANYKAMNKMIRN